MFGRAPSNIHGFTLLYKCFIITTCIHICPTYLPLGVRLLPRSLSGWFIRGLPVGPARKVVTEESRTLRRCLRRTHFLWLLRDRLHTLALLSLLLLSQPAPSGGSSLSKNVQLEQNVEIRCRVFYSGVVVYQPAGIFLRGWEMLQGIYPSNKYSRGKLKYILECSFNFLYGSRYYEMFLST